MNERPPLPSLLDRAPALPGLSLADLDDDERAQVEGTAHPCGEFTAARFQAAAPAKYEQVARALAEGFSLDAVRRVFGIHERTAAAVREREARSLSAEQYRGIQARHARGVVLAATDILADRLRKDPDAIGTRDLVAAVRELHNVERSLEGAPASVVGVIRADGASAALADLLRQADEAAGNRFGEGKTPPREVPAPLPAEVVEAVASDTDSHAKQAKTEEMRASDTALDTPSTSAVVASAVVGDDDGRAATGAGGVPAQQGGPFGEDRLGSENFCPVARSPHVGEESKEGEDSDAR